MQKIHKKAGFEPAFFKPLKLTPNLPRIKTIAMKKPAPWHTEDFDSL